VSSVYALKPRFQGFLRPAVRGLARGGITANFITISAACLSAATGLFLSFGAPAVRWWLVFPAVMLVRMALNAMDGMLAREFGQRSVLGAYLNEIADVVSDALLYLPFAYLPGFDPLWMGAVIVLAVISEMTGTIAAMTGASRRNDGPMGKSDRAVVFSALASWIGIGGSVATWLAYSFPRTLAILLALTIVNRVRRGLAENHA
jgi:CDP-diacylglycerol--glycerol-3-phosphate 3-phosphatidyltransferase